MEQVPKDNLVDFISPIPERTRTSAKVLFPATSFLPEIGSFNHYTMA
jgi:hypothetical protein